MFDPSIQPKASPKFKKSTPGKEPSKAEEPPMAESPPEPTPKGSKISDEELKKQLSLAKEKHKEIEQQLETFLMKSGLSKEMIKTFLDNPNNFTTAGWKILQSKRDNLTQKIWDHIGGEKSDEATLIKAKQKLKGASVQKGKTLGARKKWLPMR